MVPWDKPGSSWNLWRILAADVAKADGGSLLMDSHYRNPLEHEPRISRMTQMEFFHPSHPRNPW
jgi:hypothetical protein